MRLKRIVGVSLIAGLLFALWRAWQARVPKSDHALEWQSAPFPFPPVPRPEQPRPAAPAAAVAPAVAAWVEPNASGKPPKTHPIKAKMSSGIYHVPGGANYERTKPDRCYVDAAAAEADGLRRAKA